MCVPSRVPAISTQGACDRLVLGQSGAQEVSFAIASCADAKKSRCRSTGGRKGGSRASAKNNIDHDPRKVKKARNAFFRTPRDRSATAVARGCNARDLILRVSKNHSRHICLRRRKHIARRICLARRHSRHTRSSRERRHNRTLAPAPVPVLPPHARR